MKDKELDKKFYSENNEAFAKVGLDSQKILGQVTSLLAPTGYGNLVTLVSEEYIWDIYIWERCPRNNENEERNFKRKEW